MCVFGRLIPPPVWLTYYNNWGLDQCFVFCVDKMQILPCVHVDFWDKRQTPYSDAFLNVFVGVICHHIICMLYLHTDWTIIRGIHVFTCILVVQLQSDWGNYSFIGISFNPSECYHQAIEIVKYSLYSLFGITLLFLSPTPASTHTNLISSSKFLGDILRNAFCGSYADARTQTWVPQD